MTENETIKHCYEVAERQCENKCGEDHIQLAKWLEELQEYRKIGTVEEVREAVEKTKAKKPTFYATNWYCPICGNLVGNSEFHWLHDFCEKCGNKIDWSEE